MALLLFGMRLTAVEELSLECAAAVGAAVKQKVSHGKLATYRGGGMFIVNTSWGKLYTSQTIKHNNKCMN